MHLIHTALFRHAATLVGAGTLVPLWQIFFEEDDAKHLRGYTFHRTNTSTIRTYSLVPLLGRITVSLQLFRTASYNHHILQIPRRRKRTRSVEAEKKRMKMEIIFVSSNYKLPFGRLNGIHHDIHSRGSRHDDGGGGNHDSHRGGSHHRHIHILHHIRGRLQEYWPLPQRTLQAESSGLAVALL